MSWYSKKAKRELWIIPLILESKAGQTFSQPRRTYVLKALEGPRKDGSVVKKVSDGDIWIKAVFPQEAVNECLLGESQDENWDRSLILIKKYHLNHEVNQDIPEFQLEVTEFAFWEAQEGFSLKNNPVYCMDVPDVRGKLDIVSRENDSRNISEELSSIPLSHLVGLMPSVEESQSAEAAITPAKANITNDRGTSGHSNSLPDSPPLLNSDDLLNELCVINSQERQQLDDIEEWKSDYIPPMLRHSSNNNGSSMELTKMNKKTQRKDVEITKDSPKSLDSLSPRNVLKLHKRTLDTNDSLGDPDEPVDKLRKTNGEIEFDANQSRKVQSMSVQVGNSLFANSQDKMLNCNAECVSASVQVGDSLHMMNVEMSTGNDVGFRRLNIHREDNNVNSSSSAKQGREFLSTARMNEDCNTDKLTPNVDTQAQRVQPSDNTDENRHSQIEIIPSREGGTTSGQSHTSGLQVDTIVRQTQQLAKNIGDYQDGVDLSCSVNDVSQEEESDSTEKVTKGIVHGETLNSPVRHQSTQQWGNNNEVHRPDFPVSPVPMLSDTATVAQEPDLELNSRRQSSTDEVKEDGRSHSESTPKTAKQQDTGLCVGSYFAAAISPPLVMPSTSHFPDGPTSPKDLHSPVHPPVRSSSSTYSTLLKKSGKHSPPRKSPSKATPSTSGSVGILSKPKTPAHKERQETLAEETRLAILSGRKQRKSTEDREDAQSVSSVGTVQIVSSSRDLDIDPVAINEEEKKVAEFRKAASGMEIMEVKLTDISPKERKMQRRPTLEITALSPKKLNKFFSSRSSSDSDGASISSSSSQKLKTFSIGKKHNKLDISLKLVDEMQGKRTNSLGPKHSKSKTPAKKKGDIRVLFTSPDRMKKSTSDPTSLSPDGSMIRKRKRIKLYKETMLMPVDDDASQNSTSQGSSDSQSSGFQSTAGSDLLLISNSSGKSDTRTISGKQTGKRPSKSDEVANPAKRKTKRNIQSKSDKIMDDRDAVTSITREEGRKRKERFIRESNSKLSPTLKSKLQSSPRVNISNMDKTRLTPSYDLTAAQRSRRRSKTPETHEADANSECDWTLPFSLSRETKLSGTASRKAHASDDVTSLLLNVSQTLEEDVTDAQKQLLNIPISVELSKALDDYLVLPKFTESS